MGFLTNIKNRFLTKEIRLFTVENSVDPETMPLLPSWFWTAQLGVPRAVNILEIRQYAKSCWVQMVENAILKQVTNIERQIVPTDDDEKPDMYEEDIKKLETLLEYPNENGDDFWAVWGPFLLDVLELDAGVVFKAKNVAGQPVQLFPFDGSKFLFKMEEHGLFQGYFQYSYKYPSSSPKFFEKEEIIYGQMKRTPETFPYGWSPLMSLQQEVEVMIQSTRWNKEFFKNNAIPAGMVAVPMPEDQLKRFRNSWMKELKGKAHKLLFSNVTGVDWKDMAKSNKDMEWLEGQKWYFHMVFANFGVSPQEVGFYENSNTSTQEGQERITVKNAVKPYLKLIEQKINREIIPELLGHDKIKFQFVIHDDVSERIEHDQKMAKLAANVYTINEVRSMEGKDPVEWGDKPMTMVLQESFAQQNGGQNPEKPGAQPGEPKKPEAPKDPAKPDEEKKSSPEFKSADLEPIEEDEAKEYDEFLNRQFNKWEKSILKNLEANIKEEVQQKGAEYIEKTWGEFLKDLFNMVNTGGFYDQIKRIITLKFNTGIDEAEKELQLNIVVGADFDAKIDSLTRRQLEGFYLPNGDRWVGIKGITKDIQKEISQIVRDGIVRKDSLEDIKQAVKEEMAKYKGGQVKGKITEGRAMRIARTESNRFQNAGKLEAYEKSGLAGKKKWVAFLDDRTSPQCKKLNGQEVDPNGIFKVAYTTESGSSDFWEGNQPPSHPHCRCTLQFVPGA